MMEFKLEHLTRTEKTGKKVVAMVRVVIFNDGAICDIKHVKIDYKFHTMINDMLEDGYKPYGAVS